jgi:hypothetical protein
MTKKAENLLASSFTRNGVVAWFATDTCDGTVALWEQLERAGLVEKQKYKSPLGHTFSYRITDAGCAHLARKVGAK